MKIYHPRAAHMNIPPQDVFYVSDDENNQLGMGYLQVSRQDSLYPDRPLRLYLCMEAEPDARDMLFGSLMARAYQIRDFFPGVKARVFSQVAPENEQMLNFYQDSGFRADDAEDRVTLELPSTPGMMPMGCRIALTPTSTEPEQQGLLQRLNDHRAVPMTKEELAEQMNRPHFLACHVMKNTGDIIGDVVLAGEGSFANVVALYVLPAYRRMGIGKAMLHKAIYSLTNEGIQRVDAVVTRRNPAQTALVQGFQARFVSTLSFLPGKDI